MRVFIGVDERQPLAFSTLAYSIARHSSKPVQITPLLLKQLPIKRRGLTEFTFSRFLVPYLCDYVGSALFLDADIVVQGDIAELFALADPVACDVHVMKQQAKFEWASVMLFNCMRCRKLTPEYIEDTAHNPLDLTWAREVGELPPEWNHCCGYAESNPYARLLHFTKGIPVWRETRGLKEDEIWIREAKIAGSTCGYQELMGNSVHAR